LTTSGHAPVAPEPNRPKVQRWARIVTRGLAVVGVVALLGSVGLYFAVKGPTNTLNSFLSDLRAGRDAHAWTQLCASDQAELSQAGFISAWQRQRAKYGASITEIDAFTFEPFGDVRHMRYRLEFRDDKVGANTYEVNVAREDDRWKVCDFFSLSRNPDEPGLLSGFQNA
jgi:hypothetical protein